MSGAPRLSALISGSHYERSRLVPTRCRAAAAQPAVIAMLKPAQRRRHTPEPHRGRGGSPSALTPTSTGRDSMKAGARDTLTYLVAFGDR